MVGAAGTLALVPLTSFDAKRREEDAPKVQEALDLFGR